MLAFDTQVIVRPKLLDGLQLVSQQAAARAVNYATKRARTAGSKLIREQVNLPAAYVNKNLKITKRAIPKKPDAEISARRRPVILGRYAATQLTKKAPGAKGDPSRGIAAGRKQAGISVKVKKSGPRKKMPKAFFIRLQRGWSGSKYGNYQEDFETGRTIFGVFLRVGRERKDIVNLYGPSVDQLFSSVRSTLAPSIRVDLVREAKRQLNLLQRMGW